VPEILAAKRFGNWYILVGRDGDDAEAMACIDATGLTPDKLAIEIAARLAYFLGRRSGYFDGSVHAIGELLTIYDYGWQRSVTAEHGTFRDHAAGGIEYFPSLLHDLRLLLRQGVAKIEIANVGGPWQLYVNNNALILASMPLQLEIPMHRILEESGIPVIDGGPFFDTFLSDEAPLDFY
jgi:hypothetical protein